MKLVRTGFNISNINNLTFNDGEIVDDSGNRFRNINGQSSISIDSPLTTRIAGNCYLQFSGTPTLPCTLVTCGEYSITLNTLQEIEFLKSGTPKAKAYNLDLLEENVSFNIIFDFNFGTDVSVTFAINHNSAVVDNLITISPDASQVTINGVATDGNSDIINVSVNNGEGSHDTGFPNFISLAEPIDPSSVNEILIPNTGKAIYDILNDSSEALTLEAINYNVYHFNVFIDGTFNFGFYYDGSFNPETSETTSYALVSSIDSLFYKLNGDPITLADYPNLEFYFEVTA